MVKLLFGTSEHAPADGAEAKGSRGTFGFERAFALGVTMGLVLSMTGAEKRGLAQISRVGTPAPSVSPSAILDLPVVELRRTDANPEVKVGDTILLTIVPENASMIPPLPELRLVDDGNLLDQGWTLGSRKVGQSEFALVPLRPGAQALPSLTIQDKTGHPIARTHPFQVQVQSSISPQDTKPQEAAPLAHPVKVDLPVGVVIAMIVGMLVLLFGAGYLGWKFYQRYRARKLEALLRRPPKPEHEQALEALDQLAKEGLLQKNLFKPYHFRLSEIMKHYIGARYGFDAPESTSQELGDYLTRTRESIGLSTERLQEILKLFSELDRVKFTDHIPEISQASQRLEEARGIILATRKLTTAILPSDEVTS